MQPLYDQFLQHLGLERQAPSRTFLDQLIERHQRTILFDTVSKLIDFHEGQATGQYLPSEEAYLRRVIEKGTGGTCWTLARGFYGLLQNLGFAVNYLYMEPGHLCLQVTLNGEELYVDVGYCAPLFKAYPLRESFRIEDVREVFDYSVQPDGNVKTTRTPGPEKLLRLEPVKLEDFQEHIVRANTIGVGPFLSRLSLFGYVEGIGTALNQNTLRRFLPQGTEEKILNEEELQHWVNEKLGFNWDLYCQARELHRQYFPELQAQVVSV